MLLSIIVPVYNVEKYLLRCIQSILDQRVSAKQIQVILVNDGSNDTSGSLCDKVANENSNFMVIHKENGGLSDARNEGIKAAQGEYLLFFDSDDALKVGSIEKITELLILHKPDVLIGFYEAVRDISGELLFERDIFIEESDVNGRSTNDVANILRKTNASPCAWRYVVRRKLIKEKNLYFEKGLLCEDVYWTPRLICEANSFWLNKDVFYSYSVREGSIMTTHNFQKAEDIFSTVENNYEYAQQKPKKQREYVNNLGMLAICGLLQSFGRFSQQEKARVSRWFKTNKAWLKDAAKCMEPQMVCLARLTGTKNALLLAAFAIRLRQKLGKQRS